MQFIMRKNDVLPNVVMTDTDMDRLPAMFQQIMKNRRELDSLLKDDVVEFKHTSGLIRNRRYLMRMAQRYCFGDADEHGQA